jgi:hypothetical protein
MDMLRILTGNTGAEWHTPKKGGDLSTSGIASDDRNNLIWNET